MANTYTKIILHIVFAVKNRESLLPPIAQQRVHKYMAATIRDMGHHVYKIGGIEDHIHILIDYRVSQPIPDMVRELKTATTKFINTQNVIPFRFAWQRGYSCFSYSPSHIDPVSNYIDHQYEHHRNTTLRDEMIKICNLFGVEFVEEYLPQ